MDICVFSFKKMLGCPPIECNKPCYLFNNKDVGKQYTGENFLKIKARRSIIKLQNDQPIKSIETIPESPEMKKGGFSSGKTSCSPKKWPSLDRLQDALAPKLEQPSSNTSSQPSFDAYDLNQKSVTPDGSTHVDSPVAVQGPATNVKLERKDSRTSTRSNIKTNANKGKYSKMTTPTLSNSQGRKQPA
jgi:hypothetical protein